MDREDSADSTLVDDASSSEVEHPHGYTLADAEMERLEAKAATDDVLDPLALNDPVGKSVEHVIMRVGLTVVIILIVAILVAQVACKNMRLSTVTDFTSGVTVENVEHAMKKGVLFGGNVVTFPSDCEVVALDASAGTLKVQMTDDSSSSIDQLASAAQGRTFALAMNVFEDEQISTVVVETLGYASAEDGSFTGDSSDELLPVLTITWQRSESDARQFTCTVDGYDLSLQSTSAKRAAAAGEQ